MDCTGKSFLWPLLFEEDLENVVITLLCNWLLAGNITPLGCLTSASPAISVTLAAIQ